MGHQYLQFEPSLWMTSANRLGIDENNSVIYKFGMELPSSWQAIHNSSIFLGRDFHKFLLSTDHIFSIILRSDDCDGQSLT